MPGDQGGRASFFLKSRGDKPREKGFKQRGGPKERGFFKPREDKPKEGGFFKSKFGGPKHTDGTHNVEKRRAEKPKSSKDAKTFDKKTYRIKKYSNKYKLDKWEDQRRKEVLKKYYKEVKKDPMTGKYTPFDFDKAAKIGDNSENDDDTDKDEESQKPEAADDGPVRYVLHPDLLEQAKQKQQLKSKPGTAKPKLEDKLDKHGKIQPFWKVKQEMQRLREEKTAKKEAITTAAKEREEAIAKYKQKKADKFKKLSKRTKTGQPLMKDRMQMLLESIQKTTNNN